jgi:hypothetical protein
MGELLFYVAFAGFCIWLIDSDLLYIALIVVAAVAALVAFWIFDVQSAIDAFIPPTVQWLIGVFLIWRLCFANQLPLKLKRQR